MKRLLIGALAVVAIGACQKSPAERQEDLQRREAKADKKVIDAQHDANKEVADEQKDVYSAQREENKDVAEEQKDVAQAQQKDEKKIAEERADVSQEQAKANEKVAKAEAEAQKDKAEARKDYQEDVNRDVNNDQFGSRDRDFDTNRGVGGTGTMAPAGNAKAEITGVITDLDKDKANLKTSAGDKYTLKYGPSFSVMQNGQKLDRSALKEGMSIRASCDLQGKDCLTNSITVEQPSAQPMKKY